jgi:phage-related protein (TIGR01555 family)
MKTAQKNKSQDGLQNVMTGLGTGKSKRSYNTWVYDLVNQWQQLDACYQTNWIARAIVDVPAQDMTREWRRIKSQWAEDIAAEEQKLDIKHHTEQALAWANLFGGAGMLMLTGQDLSKPLQINQVKKGDLERVLVFDRWELSAQQLNTWDVLAPNYLMPEFYTIQGGHQTIHWSHVVQFFGERLPRRQMALVQGWGDSVLRKCLSDINDMVAAKDGIAELMQEANIDVLKRNGLADELASDQDDAIVQRYELFSLMKSNIHMALLDGEESVDRKTLNLGGVAPIIELFITWISGAAKVPVTKLFGTSAKGLNATGDGDMRNYYDRIRADQMSKLTSPMRKLDEVLVRSAVGEFPKDFDYVWNPLEQPNVTETEQANLIMAQRNQIYLDSGLVTKSQIMRELQATEQYQYDDEELNTIEENDSLTMLGEIRGGGNSWYIDPEGESGFEREEKQKEYEQSTNRPNHKP